MRERPYILRYGLIITGADHGEWQGVLQNDDGNREFKSVLQLLNLISQDELNRQKPSKPETDES